MENRRTHETIHGRTTKVGVKVLPQHLKYAYLGDAETMPIIIALNLTREKEDQLLKVLRKH